MIDVATSVKENQYKGFFFKTASFMKCLQELSWISGEGMMNAIELYTGMNNNGVYCPTLEIVESGELQMVWENAGNSLTILLRRNERHLIRYAACRLGKSELIRTTTLDEARTLLEGWASFVNQDDKPNDPTFKNRVRAS